MKKLISIGEMAKLANTTTETLRHYDRIGLLKPSEVNSTSRYRYYSETDLIYINVINFCKTKNMSLKDIKEVLEKDDLEYIVTFLSEKEEEIKNEIKRLRTIKSQIGLLKDKYRLQLNSNINHTYDNSFKEKYISKRAIVKIEELKEASIDNFSNFDVLLSRKISHYNKEDFNFDEGINLITKLIDEDEITSMFIICNKYPNESDFIDFLPQGMYLYTFCNPKEKDEKIREMIKYVRDNYNINSDTIIQKIIFTGMFSWRYEIQIFCSQ